MNKKHRILISLMFLIPIMCFGQSAGPELLDSVTISPNPYYLPQKENDPIYKGYVEINRLPNNLSEITIYSINGELIKTLKKKEGENSVLWFLRNEKGELISSGVFIIYLKTNNSQERIFKFYYKGEDSRSAY